MEILEIAKTKVRGQKVLTFPLKLVMGSIFDQNGRHVLDLRGWGGLSYHEKGEELQDGIGKWILETLNKEYELLKWDSENN